MLVWGASHATVLLLYIALFLVVALVVVEVIIEQNRSKGRISSITIRRLKSLSTFIFVCLLLELIAGLVYCMVSFY